MAGDLVANELLGKVVVITGSRRGIGRARCYGRLCRIGARVDAYSVRVY